MAERPRRAHRAPRGKRDKPAARVSSGPYSAVGPYDDEGTRYEVRLERVPGGLRLAEWAAGSIRRRAPVLAAEDLADLIGGAVRESVLGEEDAAPLSGALSGAAPSEEPGVSPGRAGELRDELRVERVGDDRVRVARWVMRPNYGWELQETPVMLPPTRYVEAISRAVS